MLVNYVNVFIHIFAALSTSGGRLKFTTVSAKVVTNKLGWPVGLSGERWSSVEGKLAAMFARGEMAVSVPRGDVYCVVIGKCSKSMFNRALIRGVTLAVLAILPK